jgi:hypothetical protein
MNTVAVERAMGCHGRLLASRGRAETPGRRFERAGEHPSALLGVHRRGDGIGVVRLVLVPLARVIQYCDDGAPTSGLSSTTRTRMALEGTASVSTTAQTRRRVNCSALVLCSAGEVSNPG